MQHPTTNDAHINNESVDEHDKRYSNTTYNQNNGHSQTKIIRIYFEYKQQRFACPAKIIL